MKKKFKQYIVHHQTQKLQWLNKPNSSNHYLSESSLPQTFEKTNILHRGLEELNLKTDGGSKRISHSEVLDGVVSYFERVQKAKNYHIYTHRMQAGYMH
jgi:hypothetical protein